MTVPTDHLVELASLQARVDALLPNQYHTSAGPVNPQSMGSAKLLYGPDSQVAWDRIWTSFCDLAMAGGPPHRGTLLEVSTVREVEDEPAGYQLVSGEIVRGIRLTTGLAAAPSAERGWIEVSCGSVAKASWLLRAVMAENVFARQKGDFLCVPAGPCFRLAKEVKNVIVAVAKTCHYWDGHLSEVQRQTAAEAMAEADPSALRPASRPEILPLLNDYHHAAVRMAHAVAEVSGRPAAPGEAPGWVGVRFENVEATAWFVRAAIAMGILARREEETLFLPVPAPELPGREAVERLGHLVRIWSGSRPG